MNFLCRLFTCRTGIFLSFIKMKLKESRSVFKILLVGFAIVSIPLTASVTLETSNSGKNDETIPSSEQDQESKNATWLEKIQTFIRGAKGLSEDNSAGEYTNKRKIASVSKVSRNEINF